MYSWQKFVRKKQTTALHVIRSNVKCQSPFRNMAWMRKAHAGLGALRLGSILPRSEKVNLTHLAKGSVRRTMSRPDAILLKWIKSAVILHLYILRLYCTCQGECTHLCIYWDDMGVFFLKNWLFTDSRCPPPSVPPSPSLISASPAVRSTWPPGKREEEKKKKKNPPASM